MHYFKLIYLIVVSLFFVGCGAEISQFFGFQTPVDAPPVIVQTPIQTPKVDATPVVSLDESLSKIGAKIGDPIFVRIFKQEKILELWVKPANAAYALCKTYPICAYSGDLGPKVKSGDKQSPEGFYTIAKHQLKPDSKYHFALNLGFPNAYDQNLGRTGTYLMVHGGCTSSGCYAMKNAQIEEIYMMAHTSLESACDTFEVHIFPFKMTPANIDAHASNPWHGFWVNLKLGFDIFERYKEVPLVRADKDRYRFFLKKEPQNDRVALRDAKK